MATASSPPSPSSPKPSPHSPILLLSSTVSEELPLSADPPPPYRAGSTARPLSARRPHRTRRRDRGSETFSESPLQSTSHRSNRESQGSIVYGDSDTEVEVDDVGLADATETTSLLSSVASPGRRNQNLSISTDDSFGAPNPTLPPESPHRSLGSRIRKYFRPLFRRKYYKALFHLCILNFPFALIVWIYLFVGTLVGTTLLLSLPLGAMIWWLTLLGSRAFRNAELSLQSKFHSVSARVLPLRRPIFRRLRPEPLPSSPSVTEAGRSPEPEYETSFLRNTYSMFWDPTSYQPIFYFLVIKASIALFLTPLMLIFVALSFILVAPAPICLRALRRIGAWQANIAVDGLS